MKLKSVGNSVDELLFFLKYYVLFMFENLMFYVF